MKIMKIYEVNGNERKHTFSTNEQSCLITRPIKGSEELYEVGGLTGMQALSGTVNQTCP